jgi:hypothetical protein
MDLLVPDRAGGDSARWTAESRMAWGAWSHLWALTRDEAPVAILDALGTVHRPDGERVGLMKVYRSESASITATTCRALRGLLP